MRKNTKKIIESIRQHEVERRKNPVKFKYFYRHLALAYSTHHADMASPKRRGCGDVDSNRFAKQGGITNGAKWYSLQGGTCHNITMKI